MIATVLSARATDGTVDPRNERVYRMEWWREPLTTSSLIEDALCVDSHSVTRSHKPPCLGLRDLDRQVGVFENLRINLGEYDMRMQWLASPRGLIKVGILLVGFTSGSVALATEDHNLTITDVGSSSSGSSQLAYFCTAQALSVNCLYNVLYIDLSTSGGQAELAEVLTAKSTGATLTKVDYTQNPDGSCYAYLVEYN
jgi:hypothetical protein